jgi:hypothetical protein
MRIFYTAVSLANTPHIISGIKRTHEELVQCRLYKSYVAVDNKRASFVRYPSRSKKCLIMEADAQNIWILSDLEACSANIIWPSFGHTTVSPYVYMSPPSRYHAFLIS